MTRRVPLFSYSEFDGYERKRFPCRHLAQFKFILPEAIVLKKVVVYDERTSCMKPDLHISFNFGVLENKEDQYMQLRKLFRARLSEFVSSHREVCHHFPSMIRRFSVLTVFVLTNPRRLVLSI